MAFKTASAMHLNKDCKNDVVLVLFCPKVQPSFRAKDSYPYGQRTQVLTDKGHEYLRKYPSEDKAVTQHLKSRR